MKKAGNFVLHFDVKKTEGIENIIGVPVNPDSYSSIRKSVKELVNYYFDKEDDYYSDNHFKMPTDIDVTDIYCYKNDLTVFLYFIITEIYL